MLSALLAEGRAISAHRPWPRAVVSADIWQRATVALAGGDLRLLSFWADAQIVNLALLDETAPAPKAVAVISLECPGGRFPSVGRHHPPAIRLERTIRDLHGLVPEGTPDARPWLDHGRWSGAPAAYSFLPVEGEDLHQIPVGPVHAGIIEPGHFRFTASGETVVSLEERLGYVHKGIESLMAGATLERAARLACHISGDSAVAYGIAFARAVEAALGVVAPPRAAYARALMAELERIANHLGDFGAICNDASFSLIYAHCGVLRETVLRAAAAAFGHRLMMDCVVPGGIAAEVEEAGLREIRATAETLRNRFPALVNIYDVTASLQDRTVGTGHLRTDLAQGFGAGGFVGRASGRAFDARRNLIYEPYDALSFTVPVLSAGDVDARVWLRIREIEQSLLLIGQLLENLPGGAVRNDIPMQAGEGLGITEGFRGDVLVWVRLSADGSIARCHVRDPSWFQWPLLEAVIEGNIVADFPLCNKSFNCSYSGHDL
jgi:Ni,Fe-hydrogenase III large subunit